MHLFPGTEFEVAGREVESGVSHTPTSREELMRGAHQRAEALARQAREQCEPWHYFVGLEGGLNVIDETNANANTSSDSRSTHSLADRRVFLEGWAYVTDGTRGHFGRSGRSGNSGSASARGS